MDVDDPGTPCWDLVNYASTAFDSEVDDGNDFEIGGVRHAVQRQVADTGG